METTTTTKQCTKCGRELPITEFSKNKSRKDGVQVWCRQCTSEYLRKMRLDKSVSAPERGTAASELAKYKPVQLIAELRRRGYKGTLTYTMNITV